MVTTNFYLTPAQFSEILGVHKQSIYNRIYNGQLKTVKHLGKHYLHSKQLQTLTRVRPPHAVITQDDKGVYLQSVYDGEYLRFFDVETTKEDLEKYIQGKPIVFIDVKFLKYDEGGELW